MKRLKLAMGTAALLAGVAANAASTKPADRPVDTPQRMLERMDRDLDGKISFEEYRNAMLRRFDASDVDGDGALDDDELPREWLAGAEAKATSGKVTWEEFGSALQPVFDRFDVDKDGNLDDAEMAAFAAARKSQEESKP